MKLSKLFQSGSIALLLSVGVTVGSIYVTVTAATTQPPADSAPVIDDEPIETQIRRADTIADVPLTQEGWLTARFSGIDISSGRLTPAAGVEVTIIAADNSRVTTTTDEYGFVAFEDMVPGVYIVNATSGPRETLSYGIRAVPYNAETGRSAIDSEAGPLSMAVQLDSALTPERDADAIDEMVRNTTVDPVEGAAGQSGRVALEYGELRANNADNTLDPRTYLEYDPRGVQLTPEGSLQGQLALMDWQGNIVPVTDLTASFISDGVVVASTRVNSDGSFEQWNLLPGTYSMVVAGRDAFGTVGIDVIAAPGNNADQFIPTADSILTPYEFGLVRGAGAFARGSDDSVAEEGVVPADAPMQGLGGDLGSGYGGGGGGVPGGGGWGELLGAAAIGLGAAALASDDDSGVASPGI